MFLNKTVTAYNGALLSHHFIEEVRMVRGQDKLHVLLHSWPDEASRLDGNAELARWSVDLELGELNLAGGLKAAIFAALLNRPMWTGAATYVQQGATLDGAKAMKWAQIKAERTRREFGTFEWDGSVFDADFASQMRIERKATQALRAIINSTPFSEDWTLADNSVRTLSASEMIALHTAMGNSISGLHATARFLRAQIDSSTTVEQVNAIAWPA